MPKEIRTPRRKRPTGYVVRPGFNEAFDKELAYTYTTGVQTVGANETDLLFIKLPSRKLSNVIIEKMRIGNFSSNNTIVKIYRNPTVNDPGTFQKVTARTVNKSGHRSSDLEVRINPTLFARGTLLNIFSTSNGATRPFDLFYRLFKPETGNTSLLVTAQNDSNNIDCHVDFDWIEEPI